MKSDPSSSKLAGSPLAIGNSACRPKVRPVPGSERPRSSIVSVGWRPTALAPTYNTFAFKPLSPSGRFFKLGGYHPAYQQRYSQIWIPKDLASVANFSLGELLVSQKIHSFRYNARQRGTRQFLANGLCRVLSYPRITADSVSFAKRKPGLYSRKNAA